MADPTARPPLPFPPVLTSSPLSPPDSSGSDGGRSNGFVNGHHDSRANGGRGPPRHDRGERGAYRGWSQGAEACFLNPCKVQVAIH